MTASEFAFLALGLILGVASGAALSIVVRARPPAPREVRVTMAHDAIPRRMATTLSGFIPDGESSSPSWGPTERADDLRATRSTGPAPHAPAPSVAVMSSARAAAGNRTPVRSPVAVRPLVGIPIRPQADDRASTRALAAVRSTSRVWTEPGQARGDRPGSTAAARARTATVGATQAPDQPPALAPVTASAATGDGSPDALTAPDDDVGLANQTPCADQRRRAEERCGLASRLREEAGTARARMLEAQRAYDGHVVRAEGARTAGDPRVLRQAKEVAWDAFRRANADERNPGSVEAAARTWLTEIDRINRSGIADASAGIREQTAASGLVTTIERLDLEADVARINAESAAEACQTSLEALAACEESSLDTAAGRRPLAPLDSDDATARAQLLAGPPLVGAPFGTAPFGTAASTPTLPFAGREPVMLKLLHGDRAALEQAVVALAGADPAAQTRWRLGLGGLVEAIVARAIEATALEFPADHPFWGLFDQTQCRDIARALTSLGYRFDGLGRFADGRLPSQRDLSLAIGYAGLDPMRVRRWPTEATMVELYREVAIAADEFLSATAPELTLGELLSLLGERAEALTDLWNAWGRIRPVLLRS